MYHQLPGLNPVAEQPVPLPTRILDLGPDIKTVWKEGLRLIATAPGDRGNYMTLSHRWGTKHHLKLTKTALDDHKRLIRFISLPKTYRDAVKVALSLGYRYLWIDALCIIQDDHEDWLQEAAKMASVYRNSSCTISAHAAYGDNDGFIRKKGYRRCGRLSHKPDVCSLVTASHLHHRGWVFQERILSRRLLHFTPEGLFLEDASGLLTSYGRRPELYDPLKDNKLNLEDAKQNPCEWYRLVEKFTTCKLTVDTDRLPAVLGLAHHYREQLDDGQCLWGLWSRSIHQGFMWTNVEESPKELLQGYDPAIGPAPTWTWARFLGRIKYPERLANCEDCVEIIDFDNATAQSPTGEPPYLLIRLKCIDLEGVNVIYSSKSFIGVEPQFRHHFMYKLKAWVSLDRERHHDVVFAKLTLAFVSQGYLKYKDGDEWGVWAESKITEHTWFYYFLLLTSSQNDAVVKYQRVGLGVFECFPFYAPDHQNLVRPTYATCAAWEEGDWRTISLC